MSILCIVPIYLALYLRNVFPRHPVVVLSFGRFPTFENCRFIYENTQRKNNNNNNKLEKARSDYDRRHVYT